MVEESKSVALAPAPATATENDIKDDATKVETVTAKTEIKEEKIPYVNYSEELEKSWAAFQAKVDEMQNAFAHSFV